MSSDEFEETQDMPKKGNAGPAGFAVPSAKQIKEYLDRYVIGQDAVKMALAVAVRNHYLRIGSKAGPDDGVELEKSNILVTGPTGTGKTLMARTLARMLGVPFAIADATTLTQAGYVGEDVENVVRYLWQNADYDERLAEMGIIYVDEIDKIASMTNNVSITRDVSGEGVQQALLKIIEGTVCRFPPNGGRKHPEQPLVEIDTTNILFICGGAFVGLDKIIAERTDSRSIGFAADVDNTAGDGSDRDPRPEDFVKFGLIPEFIGRLPVVVSTEELTEDDLVKVMTEPKNAIVKQYGKLMAMGGTELEFKPDALRKIAALSAERGTGARGLRAIIEKIMMRAMYDPPKGKLVVDETFVGNGTHKSVPAGKKRRKARSTV